MFSNINLENLLNYIHQTHDNDAPVLPEADELRLLVTEMNANNLFEVKPANCAKKLYTRK